MQPTELKPSDAATMKRNETNRQNSQHSCGPTTESGKHASSLNALKFGFFSEKALLPGESWKDFEEFHNQLFTEFAPRNAMERHVFAQYVGLAWRIKRLPEIEAKIFARYGISVQGNQCGSAFAMVANLQTDDILGQLARYEATLRKNAFKYLDLFRTLRRDGWAVDPSIIQSHAIDAAEEESPKIQPVNPDSESLPGNDEKTRSFDEE